MVDGEHPSVHGERGLDRDLPVERIDDDECGDYLSPPESQRVGGSACDGRPRDRVGPAVQGVRIERELSRCGGERGALVPHDESEVPLVSLGVRAQELFEREHMVERVRALAPYFESGLHGLKGLKHITDIRNYGLAGTLQIEPRPGEPLRRPYEIATQCWERGFYVRWGGDTLQFGPPFISEREDLDRLFNTLNDIIPTVA